MPEIAHTTDDRTAVPHTTDDLTATWFTRVLRESSGLDSLSLTDVEIEPTGTGQLGSTVRAILQYDGDSEASPAAQIDELYAAGRTPAAAPRA